MTKLNRDYVLAPFHALISDSQNNVLMGLRLVEATDKFPDPTPEELKFFQLSFGSPLADLKLSTGAQVLDTLERSWRLTEVHQNNT